jgi:hypothetical protein
LGGFIRLAITDIDTAFKEIMNIISQIPPP